MHKPESIQYALWLCPAADGFGMLHASVFTEWPSLLGFEQSDLASLCWLLHLPGPHLTLKGLLDNRVLMVSAAGYLNDSNMELLLILMPDFLATPT